MIEFIRQLSSVELNQTAKKSEGIQTSESLNSDSGLMKNELIQDNAGRHELINQIIIN